MSAAASKRANAHSADDAARPALFLKTERKAERSTVDYRILRARAGSAINELLRLAEHRLKHNEKELNWHNLAYCWAVPVLMFPSGPYEIVRGKHAPHYQRKYFASWPDCTADALLGAIGVAHPPDWVVEAVAAGIVKARRRRAKGFIAGDTAAKMLEVNRAERDLLQLRGIGAVDFLRPQRKAEAKERRRERDRVRKEAERRASGARPRSQSAAVIRPWEHFNESRASFYRRPKDERDAMLVEALRERETNSSPHIYPSGIYRPGDGTVSADSPAANPSPPAERCESSPAKRVSIRGSIIDLAAAQRRHEGGAKRDCLDQSVQVLSGLCPVCVRVLPARLECGGCGPRSINLERKI
jgi:hypothetical protein